jgi:hypothetical protein
VPRHTIPTTHLAPYLFYTFYLGMTTFGDDMYARIDVERISLGFSMLQRNRGGKKRRIKRELALSHSR